MNKAKVAGGKAIISCGYSAKPFDPCEEVFNDMPFPANALHIENFPLSILSPWNQGKTTASGNFITQGIAVVSFVGQDNLFAHITKKLAGRSDFSFLPRQQHHLKRLSRGIDERVELGVAASFGFSKHLIWLALGSVAGILMNLHV